MKEHIIDNIEKLADYIVYFNKFHDGIIKQIKFLKKREISKDGDIISFVENKEEMMLCNIDIEMLLNSYVDAKNDQIIVLNFDDVIEFNFRQTYEYDYAEIYDVNVYLENSNWLIINFFATKNKTLFLTLKFKKVIIKEL